MQMRECERVGALSKFKMTQDESLHWLGELLNFWHLLYKRFTSEVTLLASRPARKERVTEVNASIKTGAQHSFRPTSDLKLDSHKFRIERSAYHLPAVTCRTYDTALSQSELAPWVNQFERGRWLTDRLSDRQGETMQLLDWGPMKWYFYLY